MGRRVQSESAFGGALFNSGLDTDDYAVEPDDGFDLVERILTAKAVGRDAFLETDVDYW